jgi:small subunit ribosomal protein S16
VVTDQRNPRAGAHNEIIGHYNPLTNPATLNLKEDRAVYWLQNGAQPSDTAAKILSRAGVMEQAGRAPVTWSGKVIGRGARGDRKCGGTTQRITPYEDPADERAHRVHGPGDSG